MGSQQGAVGNESVHTRIRFASAMGRGRYAVLAAVFILAVYGMQPFEPQRLQVATHADSALLRAAVQAEAKFFEQWRKTWMRTMDKAIRIADGKASKRDRLMSADEKRRLLADRKKDDGIFQSPFVDIHCHWDGTFGAVPRIIASAERAQAQCPNWLRDTASLAAFDVRAVGPVLRAVSRDSLLARRHNLTRLLDSAARLFPANTWIAGQRVRFLIDDGDTDGALRIARSCTASRWWCSALAGYALHQRGDVVSADSAFGAATSATAGDARCDWTSVASLLESSIRATFRGKSCTQRDSLSAIALWLADPLFGEPGNERRAEHFARRVSILLHSALTQDEVYNWSLMFGGDAVAEMVMRYGWPSRVRWMGTTTDEEHESWLVMQKASYAEQWPYTSADYTRGRIHLVPSWSAITDPFHAGSDDWALNPDSVEWWPAEHFMPLRPLAQVADEQVGLFRRASNVLLAYATELGEIDIGRRPSDTVTAITFRSTGPDAVERSGEQRVGAAAHFLMRESIPAVPAVIGIEIPNPGGHTAGRMRFGVTPPAPLSSIKPGEVDISQPLILAPPPGDEALPNSPADAIPLMLGTTRIRSGSRIGVYWETYGLAATDSIEIAVRVQRHTPQGVLRGLGIAINLASDKNAPVQAAWKEPDRGTRVYPIAGPVAAIGRSVVLDISSLPQGDYWLDVLVNRPGKPTAMSRRPFVVR